MEIQTGNTNNHIPDFLCVSRTNVLAGLVRCTLTKWCVIRGSVMLAAPTLISTGLDYSFAEKEIDLLQDGAKIQQHTDIYH